MNEIIWAFCQTMLTLFKSLVRLFKAPQGSLVSDRLSPNSFGPLTSLETDAPPVAFLANLMTYDGEYLPTSQRIPTSSILKTKHFVLPTLKKKLPTMAEAWLSTIFKQERNRSSHEQCITWVNFIIFFFRWGSQVVQMQKPPTVWYL